MKPKQLLAPCSGSLFRLKMVRDLIFASQLTGDGVAIRADDTNFYAMCDGVVKAVFKSNNCVVIESDDHVQFLLYVGLNTLYLNSKGIECLANVNQRVKQGDLLVRVDLDKIGQKKVDLTTVVIVMNPKAVEKLTVTRHGICKARETIVLSYQV